MPTYTNTNTKSRAQREGYQSGKINGRIERGCKRHKRSLDSMIDGYYKANRKARKRNIMDVRNSERQGAYGGFIKDFVPSLDHLPDVPDTF